MGNPTISWYDDNAEQLASRYDQADAAPLHALLAKWIPSGSNVLEIGCGSGRDAFFLASLGCTVTALDGSESMIAEARKKTFCAGSRKCIIPDCPFPPPRRPSTAVQEVQRRDRDSCPHAYL